MTAPRIHRRQFVLGPEPFIPTDGWTEREIAPSLHLSHCRELPVASITGPDGASWQLLGMALQSDPEKPSPAEQFETEKWEELLDVYGSWSGRWLLVGESELHLDAGGTLGCFYRTIHRGRTAELWASSSPALISALPGREPVPYAAPRLFHGKGMDWYPPPRSRFAGVNRLLPSQILSLRQGGDRLLARPLLVPVAQPQKYEQVLNSLQSSIVTSLSRLHGRSESVWLPLTSGVDSRLILAGAAHAGLRLTTFTHARRYPTMPTGDRELPPLLAREVGYEHRYLRPARYSRKRRELFDAHTALHCIDEDRKLFARGQWEAIPPPALILRGGVFEVGRCLYHPRFPGEVPDVFASIAHRFRFEEFHADSFAHIDGIAEWVDWMARNPQSGLDWRDRLYLEQRVGGWVSSIEQALDLTSYERVYIANCHRYMATALSLPETVRRTNSHHLDLIARMAPGLARFPFNPADDPRLAFPRAVRNEWQDLAAQRRKFPYVIRRVVGARHRVVRLFGGKRS